MHLGMAIAVSMEGYRFHPWMASWDGDRSIPGWRSMHPGMAIDASVDGDLYTTRWRRSILGWRSMHPGMVIMYPGCISLHPGMEIDESREASREGD